MKRILKNKFLGLILIPFILILFWLGLSLITYKNFTTLTYTGGINSTRKLLAGASVDGSFIAKENNLGIVLLRVNNYVKPDYENEDILVFKLKEEGAKDWYYEGNYRSGAFEHTEYFPFGFPIINKSKGKRYIFQLTSLKGNNTNAISVSNEKPNLESEYKFTKKDILSNKKELLNFSWEKLITSFTNMDFLLYSTLFLFPLIVYLLGRNYLLYGRKEVIPALPYLTVILILIDALFVKNIYSGILLCLILLWIYGTVVSRISSRKTFLFAFSLVFFWSLLMLTKIPFYQFKFNVWVYFLLVLGAIQAVVEEKILRN